MPFKKGENPNHPAPGSTLIVDPIRDRRAIKRIRKLLAGQTRNTCIFNLGINTAFRASELLRIRVQQVRELRFGDDLVIKQPKTQKYRRVTLNNVCIESIQHWLAESGLEDDQFLFQGQRGPLTVPTLSRLVKQWCADVGLHGNFASHTLRKTWGYWQRIGNNTPIPLLMVAFGHSTQQQTLDYLGIQDDEIKSVYLMEI